jgi:ubiquinone/menaquinone biosynthesis C-methylase UbiE
MLVSTGAVPSRRTPLNADPLGGMESIVMSVSEEEIAAASAYEELHVPALFEQWADRVLDSARVGDGDRVLDVACGTGILARKAAARVGSDGCIAGVDPNPGMLVVAERFVPSVRWQESVAESLPYDDGSFDAVVSQFGLMFFADRDAALREMKRVLVSGGRMAVAVWESLERSEAYPIEVAVAVWESLERSEAYPIEVELLEQIAGSEAAEALRAPFVLGDPTELEKLFRSAGVESVDVATHRGTARFPSVRTMVEADLRGWLPVMGVVLPEGQIQRILGEAERALRRYVTAEGTVEFESPAHIVSGTRS